MENAAQVLGCPPAVFDTREHEERQTLKRGRLRIWCQQCQEFHLLRKTELTSLKEKPEYEVLPA
jgi:hypothetical protein